MGSFIKDFALTALIIILNHWVYGIEDTIAYDFMVEYITGKNFFFLTAAFLGSFALVLSAALFENLGLYQITYVSSRVVTRLTRFAINFFSTLNLVFYTALGSNLLRDQGYQFYFALVLLLGSSYWALRIIDFNYPVKNNVIPVGILALGSLFLVEFADSLSHF